MGDAPSFHTQANPRPRFDIHNPQSKVGQIWVKSVRKIYNPLGFKKGYNFPLFILGAGGLMGFCLSRITYFDFEGKFAKEAIPGEFYWYRGGLYKIGILLHMIGVLPGGVLASLQFIPIIRYKAILFHRINGYAAILFLLLGIAGAWMIVPHAVGGPMNLKLWTGAVGVLLIVALCLAWYNIKRLQIDQHRIWMLRAWTWAASIATLRIIMLAALHVMNKYGHVYHEAIRCAEIFYMYQHAGVPDQGNPTRLKYPTCALNGTNPATNTQTFVSVISAGSGPENVAARIRAAFPMSAWLALLIHVIAIETYLWLTPAESYRLRQVSYERQVEKGLRERGSFKDAGLTSTRFGNAPKWWSVPTADYEEEKRLMGMAPAKQREGSDSESETAYINAPKHGPGHSH